jgi:hypothetical protein
MKWIPEAISGQHLYLKLALFITGIGTGLSSSIRIISVKIVLFLLYLLMEPTLYCYLFHAFKRLVPFFIGYWMFSIILSSDFLISVRFSLQLLYFLVLMVSVFGAVSMQRAISDSSQIRQWKWVDSLFAFCLATMLYIKSFSANFVITRDAEGKQAFLEQIESVLVAVNGDTENIKLRLDSLMNAPSIKAHWISQANVTGLFFLALLVIVNGL